ncbi:Uncharacterised protein [Mycobacteroides abscessus subsp. bolletii]|uniref:hypothetical protein n=1 Tax=Mycobacteroides abscessus TaxID=36809 RepID=UPI0009A6DAEB|nr:hypothetical protein [Mycobacteroides abscessus]SKS75215.1 Uncharacterised protein [Mycobacteroides abscessus subsp. bolletii]SKS81706.1 Uncharacterised protein [Mycobacteroides abscessus subsp. bolletii]
MSAQVYYHGGVVGRRPGDLICSALDLGRDYTEDYKAVRGVLAPLLHDPAFVYLTTHLGSARGYAARYKNLAGIVRPGDVYTVQPQADLSPDPEYDNPSDPGHFVRTRQPVVVTEVVERGVQLTRREQNREAWPRACFSTWQPLYASDGTVQLSDEMRDAGFTDDYVKLLPKWIDFQEFSNRGAIWKPGHPETHATAEETLDFFDYLHLDTGEHLIEAAFNQSLHGNLVCTACGQQFGVSTSKVKKADVLDATVHQAGEALGVIAQFNGGVGQFLHALRRRNPQRWRWLTVPGR